MKACSRGTCLTVALSHSLLVFFAVSCTLFWALGLTVHISWTGTFCNFSGSDLHHEKFCTIPFSLLSIFWGCLTWIAFSRSCQSIRIGLKAFWYSITSVLCSLSCCITQLQLSFTWHSLSIQCCALAVMFAGRPLLETASTVLNFIYRQFVLQWTNEHQDFERKTVPFV